MKNNNNRGKNFFNNPCPLLQWLRWKHSLQKQQLLLQLRYNLDIKFVKENRIFRKTLYLSKNKNLLFAEETFFLDY